MACGNTCSSSLLPQHNVLNLLQNLELMLFNMEWNISVIFVRNNSVLVTFSIFWALCRVIIVVIQSCSSRVCGCCCIFRVCSSTRPIWVASWFSRYYISHISLSSISCVCVIPSDGCGCRCFGTSSFANTCPIQSVFFYISSCTLYT